VGGAPFLSEDLTLLKCLGDQIAAGLRNLRLSEKLMRAKEMEAFQAMSAFLVHDLKNTASSLSLTLRNLPVHFDNPEFRKDALRTLSKSVDRVNELISRLTSLRQKLELNRQKSDLNEVVAAAVQSMGSAPGVSVRQRCEILPPILIDAHQIESVVTNLVLNARDAIHDHGEIEIETARQDGGAILAVSDNGCGMSPEFVRTSLFQPFKTSKKNGLGIGMFQTKTIVEAHGGRIVVRSQPGKGSTFQIWLPITASPEKD
jgi:putative PEP-CTERM system histidine kinase